MPTVSGTPAGLSYPGGGIYDYPSQTPPAFQWTGNQPWPDDGLYTRFSLPVPQGAIIVSASYNFTHRAGYGTTKEGTRNTNASENYVRAYLYCVAADNPGYMTCAEILAAARTSQTTVSGFVGDPMTVGNVPASLDVRHAIQDIVNRPGWTSGNHTWVCGDDWSSNDGTAHVGYFNGGWPSLSVTYNNPPTTPGAFTSPTSSSVFNTSHSVAWGASTDPNGDAITYRVELSTNGGSSFPYVLATANSGTSLTYDFSAIPASASAVLRVRATDALGASSAWQTSSTFTIQHNQTPNAPTPTTPANGTPVDRTGVVTLGWTLSDPDVGDSSSAYRIRYRLVAAGSWTELAYVTSTATSHGFSAGALTAGDYEWQVRHKDSQGAESPYSASAFFTAADPPSAPTITYPANGGTIVTSSDEVEWSTPDQEAFQVRKVADAAGSPDTGNVYYDSTATTSTTARDHALTFPTNTRWEHLQVRRKYLGLWSAWSSVRVLVDYTPPATPTVALSEAITAAARVTVTNPTPTGTQPTVTVNYVHRRRAGDTGDGQRLAIDVEVNGAWDDWSVASGKAYEFRAEAVGANGTTTLGAWTA